MKNLNRLALVENVNIAEDATNTYSIFFTIENEEILIQYNHKDGFTLPHSALCGNNDESVAELLVTLCNYHEIKEDEMNNIYEYADKEGLIIYLFGIANILLNNYLMLEQ